MMANHLKMWERTGFIENPESWGVFSTAAPGNSDRIEYEIVTIEDELHREVINFMTDNYLRDEPTCRSKRILCDSSSIHDIQSVWMKILQQNCSLLCYRKDTNAIVGLYILGVAVSGVLPEFQFTGDVWPELQMLYGYVHNQFDAFASYNVDKYFLSAGLSVEPEYRGRGIGTELVKSGIKLGQKIGIKVTHLLCTDAASQRIMDKLNFDTNFTISYSDLGQVHPQFRLDNIHSTQLQLRTFVA